MAKVVRCWTDLRRSLPDLSYTLTEATFGITDTVKFRKHFSIQNCDTCLAKCFFVILLWVVLRILRNNLLWFDEFHDFLAYHLPFGIKIFDPSLIQLAPPLEDLFRGAPLLLHFLIGLVWKLDPFLPINATHMLGITMWLALLPLIYVVVRSQVLFFGLTSLGVPLVLIHTMSGAIDLPANIFLFIVLISIFQLQSSAETSRWWVACGILAITAVSCSKYTLMPLAIIVGMIFAAVVYVNQYLSLRLKILLIPLAVLMGGSWSIRNAVVLGNPIYPLRPPVIGDFVPHTWPMPGRGENWPSDLKDAPQPVVTIASIVELSAPDINSVMNRYQDDQWGNGPGTRGFRMGGFWWPLVSFFFGVIAFAFKERLIRSSELAPFGVLVGITLFLPHSHELRYFLYIPLMLAFFAAVVVHRLKNVWIKPVILVGGLMLVLCSWWINWN